MRLYNFFGTKVEGDRRQMFITACWYHLLFLITSILYTGSTYFSRWPPNPQNVNSLPSFFILPIVIVLCPRTNFFLKFRILWVKFSVVRVLHCNYALIYMKKKCNLPSVHNQMSLLLTTIARHHMLFNILLKARSSDSSPVLVLKNCAPKMASIFGKMFTTSFFTATVPD